MTTTVSAGRTAAAAHRPPAWESVPEPLWYAVFAGFAGLFAVLAGPAAHRVWGTVAAAGYAGAALVAGTSRTAGRVCAFTGAALIPLMVLLATSRAQEEVSVVARSGAALLRHGTPYPRPPADAAYTSYDPYLPGMAVFGLTGLDPRILFTGVFAAAIAAGTVVSRSHGGPRRVGRAGMPAVVLGSPLVVILASPLVALPVAVGGDDLPVLGCACLGLALARHRPGTAGLVLGAAGTLKLTASPVLITVFFLLRARGQARRYVIAATAVLTAGVGVPAALDPSGFATNVVLFPMGLTPATSPAASPLPGHLLAGLGPAGHAAAVTLLVLAAVAVGVSLVLRPPPDVRAAARRAALGLALAVCLLPATRWGYLLYPAVLAAWSRMPGHVALISPERAPEGVTPCLAA
ncbi:glycosyltransferase 87 family protein [Actinoallomurus vinaceus]|uniref:Glycosyltransferase 87 family protein n=1 Tax=Actinoallomurus vinaceus TaxID=1080074 RepID=A0ABP8UHK3_9ACTN